MLYLVMYAFLHPSWEWTIYWVVLAPFDGRSLCNDEQNSIVFAVSPGAGLLFVLRPFFLGVLGVCLGGLAFHPSSVSFSGFWSHASYMTLAMGFLCHSFLSSYLLLLWPSRCMVFSSTAHGVVCWSNGVATFVMALVPYFPSFLFSAFLCTHTLQYGASRWCVHFVRVMSQFLSCNFTEVDVTFLCMRFWAHDFFGSNSHTMILCFYMASIFIY